MDNRAFGILQFEIRRDIVSLYKRYLNQLEDMKQEHASMFKKLEESLPSEYHSILKSADYLDDNKFNYLRKRVLDFGNEAIRGIDEQLKQFDIDFGGIKKQG